MNKLLFSALIIVSTLAYLAPAYAQNLKTQNNVNCSNITQNNTNKSNTQSSNCAGQSKKCNRVPSTKPANRGKPANPRLPTSR